METCEWTEGPDGEYWATGCDDKWAFTVEGPEENNVNFCPCCGKPVVAIYYKENDEEST